MMISKPASTSRRAQKHNILAALLNTAKEKRQLCLEKRWKFKKSNGWEVILRDVVEKILVWVDKFKDIGDAAVQLDPVHASLPWAGVRFLLQMSAFWRCWTDRR
jgi:hypothetical protein